MKDDVKLLEKEFTRVKELGLVKSLRKGPTGIGFTFETLLNKKEDQSSTPDFRSIELKCKYAYSKSPLALFNCSPFRDGEFATRYIFETYGYHAYNNPDNDIIFYRRLYSNYSLDYNGYKFNLQVDYDKKQILMIARKNGKFVENVCYWDFELLEHRLTEKLTNLAIVYAYPYRRNNSEYFKYVKMDIYKLKSFSKFLELIENDEVFIQLFIKEGVTSLGTPRLDVREVAFEIKRESITRLFDKIK